MEMPAIFENSAPAKCCVLPIPDEPYVICPGLDLAKEISCATVFTGNEDLTTNTLGT